MNVLVLLLTETAVSLKLVYITPSMVAILLDRLTIFFWIFSGFSNLQNLISLTFFITHPPSPHNISYRIHSFHLNFWTLMFMRSKVIDKHRYYVWYIRGRKALYTVAGFMSLRSRRCESGIVDSYTGDTGHWICVLNVFFYLSSKYIQESFKYIVFISQNKFHTTYS